MRTPNPNGQQFPVRVSVAMAGTDVTLVREVARAEDRTASDVIRRAIRREIARHQAEQPRIEGGG